MIPLALAVCIWTSEQRQMASRKVRTQKNTAWLENGTQPAAQVPGELSAGLHSCGLWVGSCVSLSLSVVICERIICTRAHGGTSTWKGV